MTHVSERELGDHLEPFLEERFGPDAVHREYRFEDGLRPDFLVEGPICRWAFELENDDPSVRDAVGQVTEYHRKAADIRPVIAVPADHVDADRFEAFRPYVLIREFDLEAGAWV
jgi:hypothetical protein